MTLWKSLMGSKLLVGLPDWCVLQFRPRLPMASNCDFLLAFILAFIKRP